MRMQFQTPMLPQSLNPSLPPFHLKPRFFETLAPIQSYPRTPKRLIVCSLPHGPRFRRLYDTVRPDFRSYAGRSKGKEGGSSGGRIEGNAELRREAKRNARRRSKKLAESLFYRLKNPHKNYPDNFSEEELQMIGLGYDRMVRFMDKDDPNLKHPYDWYKYGEFGPYSWRGVVLGEPIRGRFSDNHVSLIGEVRDQEEWEKIERYDMAVDFQKGLDAMDKSKRFRYYWVFVRHPKWRISDLPWEQWTLVCEVVLEAGDQRLDKWTLMGRLGNNSRAMITQCAAWMRPDIIYVKRPVYQCRFEPQDDFFGALTPLLDPESEEDFMFEMENDDGTTELCTYFGGLCKMVKVNPKAFVDDVVNAYQKLSDEKKSKCLEFLLGNHPVMLLHPYTKEWKAKLEDLELGCDAPDESDDRGGNLGEDGVVMDWIEDDGYDDAHDGDEVSEDEEDQDDLNLDTEGTGDDVLGVQEDEDTDPEEDASFWDEEFKKAMRSNEDMEKLVKRSIETSTKFYGEQMKASEPQQEKVKTVGDGDELEMRGKRAKVSPEEWKRLGYGPFRKRTEKSKIPPGLFLRAAVRPFTYRNLVKEIVLTRHAILEGDIATKK